MRGRLPRERARLPDAAELVRTGLLAASVALAAAVGFYGVKVASGSALFFTHDLEMSDIWHLNYPMKHFYANELRAGRLPLWCPSIGTGFPLHAEGQVGSLYPSNLLLFGLLPLELAFNWSILLHALLAAGFAAAFARELGAGRGGSVLAGTVFAFSGFFVTHLKHINMVAAAVWIPLLLLLLERFVRRRRPVALAGFALVVAVTILAGHPQIAYNHLLVSTGYAIYLLVGVWREGGSARGLPRALGLGGGLVYAVLLGLALGAPQILPTRELIELSPRRGGMSLEQATRWEYRYDHLLAFLRPKAFGDPGELEKRILLDPATGAPFANREGGEPIYALDGFEYRPDRPMLFWEMTGYVGLLPLALAGGSLALGLRSRRVSALLALLIASLLLTLGKNGGLFHLFYRVVPGFDLFRFQARFLLYAELALATMAGIGLTLVLERFAGTRRAATRTAVTVLAVACCFADLKLVLGDHNPTIEAERWTRPPPSAVRIRAEQADRIAPFRMADLDWRRFAFINAYFRARGWKGDLAPYDPAKNVLHANLNLLYDLANLHLYFQIPPRWSAEISQLFFLPLDPDLGVPRGVNGKVASLFNVRYLIDTSGVLLGKLPLLAEYPGDVVLQAMRFERPALRAETGFRESAPYRIRLHENPHVLPRALLVPKARLAGKRYLRSFLDASFHPLREVLITDAPGETPPTLGEAGPPIAAPVRFVRYQPDRVEMRVDAPRDCWLFLADTYYPGWVATVDGEETRIYRANIAGRAVRLSRGRHDVVLEYAPASFRRGVAAALLGAALLVSLGPQGRLARRLASSIGER